jgi:phenylalanyl-tRNA synthetase beta chain
MKVSKQWLKQLVNYSVSDEELINLFNHKTIGTKEVTEDFIELDMKGYNRADLLSLRGVAYEVSALTESVVNFEEPVETSLYWVEKQLPAVSVEVADEKLSPLYCLVKIEGLKVENSSEEWKKKLTDSGIRSVNNMADVTNLVMLEYGQPLHAFDYDSVKRLADSDLIVVRRAKTGEKLVTLDHKTRDLTQEDIVISGEKVAVGLAGVMGGENTEVTNQTTSILLEAAIFDPGMLRKTANRLALGSEASKRFYHGLKAKRLFQALDASIKMYEDLGGKVTGISIVGETLDQLKTVPLRLSKINQLIGETLSASDVEKYLKRLHFSLSEPISTGEETSWVVTVPYFRLDVELEEDLIEEVARMYGYEKITSHSAANIEVARIDQSKFDFLRKLSEKVVALGLTEVSSYPYFSSKALDSLGWAEKDKSFLVKIANPISSETQYLRQSIWPNLVEVIDKNMRQGFKDMAIFEIGKSYYFDTQGNPKEGYRLAIALMNGSENPLAELNAIVAKINVEMNLGVNIKQAKPEEIAEYFVHPTRYTEVIKDGEQIGGMSEVHKRVTDFLGIDKRVAVFEVELTSFLS